jgi:hypothetical protein
VRWVGSWRGDSCAATGEEAFRHPIVFRDDRTSRRLSERAAVTETAVAE